MAAVPSSINGSISTGPNLWTHDSGDGDNDEQYAVWVHRDLNVSVARRLHRLPFIWQEHEFSGSEKTWLGLPQPDDDHRAWCVFTDHEGYVHVVGNHHGSPPHYVKSDAALSVVGGWSDESANFPETATGITYPVCLPFSDARVLCVWRFGASGNGDTYFSILDTSSPAAWSTKTRLLNGITSGDSAYAHAVWIDRNDRIHIAWSWQADDDPPDVDFSYIYSDDDGATWHAADGTTMTVPITKANDSAANIGDPTPPGSEVLGNHIGIAVDGGNGDVYITITTDKGHCRWYKKWNGSSWTQKSLTILDPQRLNPGVVPVLHKGELWGLSNRGGRAYARPLVNPDAIEDFYGRVDYDTPGGWSGPRFDPVWYKRTGQVQTLMIDENDNPVVHTLGEHAGAVG